LGVAVPVRGAVLRGPVRVRLIHDLAIDAWTERDLAERYGVSQPSIHEFKDRHATQIAIARESIENHISTLWIADKVARLSELEDDVECINTALTSATLAEQPRLYLAKHRALRNAAEELGQLAPRAIDATVTVKYQIVGVDMAALE
jgi:hypothetical protein